MNKDKIKGGGEGRVHSRTENEEVIYRERKEIAVEGNVKWFTIHWDRPSKETHTVKRSQYNPCSHTVLQQ
jgi:ribosomal 30S subunit maturation factor RimM